MFTQKELDLIEIGYFRIIQMTGYAVTIQSKNTQHCWHILSRTYKGFSACLIYHTHREYTPYHLHGHAPHMSDAIRLIKEHDEYQIGKMLSKRVPHV